MFRRPLTQLAAFDMQPGSYAPPSQVEGYRLALAQSEARYASLVDRIGYGAYRSTPDGRLLEVNSTLVAMLGYSRSDELLDVDLTNDVYLDPGERTRIEERPASPVPEWILTQWKRRDGSTVTVRVCVQPVVDESGNLEGYDGIVEDVTERRRHDELLRRTERMASLGTTLAGVAHELNNPLAAIIGFTQLLLRKPWPTEDRAALETINHEAIRSAAIVRDLLSMTRKRDAERRVSTDMNDIVGYIARTRRYALETAGIGCSLELQPALPSVFGDRAQLEQVVLNLLSNAEHALASAGAREARVAPRIVIRTRQLRDEVIVEIHDNGPGIPEAVQSRIWDPFWTTKEEGEGTGLGLSVVHGIVADHGGTICLESTPETGARFIVSLPIATETIAIQPPGQAVRPLDVLVVDPGASDLLFVERFLTARGHAVVNAGSGELALRLADQTSFDAVLCDARLVGRDGTAIAVALRSMDGCSGARFVLSMPEQIDGRPVPSTLEGAAVVARPYDVEELRRLIEGE
jgi:two-component system, cell cycle sensor histidine kinase and response regulator CckA